MKREYQYPIITTADMSAIGVLMASKKDAGGDPKVPGDFAPSYRSLINKK